MQIYYFTLATDTGTKEVQVYAEDYLTAEQNLPLLTADYDRRKIITTGNLKTANPETWVTFQ